MKYTLAICAALLLSACASTPTAPIALEPQVETLSPGMARIYFLRDSGTTSNTKLVRINVNGKEVGSIAKRSSFFIDRIPGNYRISVETFSTPAESVIDIQLEADKRHYVQIAEHERQSRNPVTGSTIGMLGGAVGGALGGWLGGNGTSVFGVTLIDSSVGEALLRKFKLN